MLDTVQSTVAEREAREVMVRGVRAMERAHPPSITNLKANIALFSVFNVPT